MGFFEKLKQGLSKTHISFTSKKVNQNLIDELEENLIISDVGFETSEEIINSLRLKIKQEKICDENDVKLALKEEIKNSFNGMDSKLHIENMPAVILMVGVNGAGKTTSIGKIANNLRSQGKKVLIVAGDTFRAGAVEQLEVWANRANCKLVKGKENQDPSSVIFDATVIAKRESYDVLICDTAGRLQNKKYLMSELEKMNKVLDRELPDSSKEVLLVLDSSVGQNAVSQLKSFNESIGVTGLVLTKLDGTAKGGIVIRLAREFKTPIKFIGIGEKIDDMQRFDSDEFVNAIIS